MKSTKKLLAPFNPTRPEDAPRDFLVPYNPDGSRALFSIQKKQSWEYGMVVYVGKELTANDLFAKIVTAKWVIPSVSRCLTELDHYVGLVKDLHIGKIVKLSPPVDGDEYGFVEVDIPRTSKGSRLP